MININLNNEAIYLNLEGDYMTIITEIIIAIARLSSDQPKTIDHIVNFLKNGLEQDIKNGLELDTIINRITKAYFESRSERK